MTGALGVWLGCGLAGIVYIESVPLHGPMLLAWVIGISVVVLRRLPDCLRELRLKVHLNQHRVMNLSHTRLFDLNRTHPQQQYLGDGFEWRARHAQWAHELSASSVPPGGHHSGWVHQLASRHAPLFQPLRDAEGHTLIVGTTGAGKTRTFDLLIAQAINRGEACIIIDPKGDRDLRLSAERILTALGREKDLVIFHPAYPEQSVRLDPLRNFNRPSELSSRISGLIPSTHPSDPFKAFGQRALDQIIQGLLFVNLRPNLIQVRRILEGGPDTLVIEALEHHLRSVLGAGWKTRIPNAARGRGTASLISGLATFYREQIGSDYPALPLEGLLALYEHDRNHFGKMVASLLPVMNLLTSGPLLDLLSPDPDNRDDVRPITDLGRIIEKHQIAYIGLDALSDGPAATMIGSLLLADLTAVAGERYNAGIRHDPVHVFIDEAAEVINEPCIQLLNKGRGAGIRMTIATQTLSDFTARMGTEARALQVLGNVNNLIAMRVMDAATQRYVTQNLPKFRRLSIGRSLGNTTLSAEPHHFTGNIGERLIEEDAELFPPALLGQLPDLHYLGKLTGGRIIKGRVPLLVTSEHG